MERTDSMKPQFQRTVAMIGEEAFSKLAGAHVLVFGVGGVGSFVCEALARAGIGELTVVDSDDVDVTNINRQIIALHSTVGRAKVEVVKERIADINPDCTVHCIKMLYLPENADEIDFERYDYIVDAIDNVSAKVEIAKRAEKLGVPAISSMGTGNKLDPTRFEVADITKTSVCPLAKAVRSRLKKEGVKHLKVVYSKEEPFRFDSGNSDDNGGENGGENAAKNGGENAAENGGGQGLSGRVPSSISFVPSVAGLIIAGEVIKDIAKL